MLKFIRTFLSYFLTCEKENEKDEKKSRFVGCRCISLKNGIPKLDESSGDFGEDKRKSPNMGLYVH